MPAGRASQDAAASGTVSTCDTGTVAPCRWRHLLCHALVYATATCLDDGAPTRPCRAPQNLPPARTAHRALYSYWLHLPPVLRASSSWASVCVTLGASSSAARSRPRRTQPRDVPLPLVGSLWNPQILFGCVNSTHLPPFCINNTAHARAHMHIHPTVAHTGKHPML